MEKKTRRGRKRRNLREDNELKAKQEVEREDKEMKER
jgi:hypothetical protein